MQRVSLFCLSHMSFVAYLVFWCVAYDVCLSQCPFFWVVHWYLNIHQSKKEYYTYYYYFLLLQGNPKTWCLEDIEYPKYEIEAALQYNYEGVQAIYKDVLANTENSVDRLKEIVQETYLCPSVTSYIQVFRNVKISI